MKILICDDDLHFARQVEQALEQYGRAHGLPVECIVSDDPAQLLVREDIEQCQAAFLDVDMKPLDGIALGRQLRRRAPGLLLVYVSAYLEFAPEGYTVQAFRYLLKRDVEKALPLCMEELVRQLAPRDAVLCVATRDGTLRLPYRDIYYLQSDLRRIHVRGAASGQSLCSFYGRLDELEPQLAAGGFVRTGKSYLVNMAYIQMLRSGQVTLCNGEELNVSRTYSAQARQAYARWRLSL